MFAPGLVFPFCHHEAAAAAEGSAFPSVVTESLEMKERTYYVYIMASKSRTLYTGITNDLCRRSLEHKSGEIDGFTRRYKIHRLVYYEVFHDVGAAIDRERQIKGWDRAKRVALIESENLTWEDLAEDWGKQVPVSFDPRRKEAFASSNHATEKQIPRPKRPRDDKVDVFAEKESSPSLRTTKPKV